MMHRPRVFPARLARRAAREFVLIVLGVLVALWFNGLNQARIDRKRERVSLAQILAATRDNERRILEARATDSTALTSAVQLLRALKPDGSLPQPDSLSQWRERALKFSVFFPMIGAYSAMAQTGDLALVRNDSLRAEIARYTGILEGTKDQMDDWTETFHRNVAELIQTIPLDRLDDVISGRSSDPAGWRIGSVRRALFLQMIISSNRTGDLDVLLEATRALRRSLEAELRE